MKHYIYQVNESGQVLILPEPLDPGLEPGDEIEVTDAPEDAAIPTGIITYKGEIEARSMVELIKKLHELL